VLLLWLAAAAGVVATMMFDGSDQLALRAIERRLDKLPMAGRAADDEVLLAVGAQLDALNDRLEELTAGRHGTGDPATDHRPQEQWSASEDVPQNDRYDQDVGSGRHWSPSRWEP
jgi:predicted ATPase